MPFSIINSFLSYHFGDENVTEKRILEIPVYDFQWYNRQSTRMSRIEQYAVRGCCAELKIQLGAKRKNNIISKSSFKYIALWKCYFIDNGYRAIVCVKNSKCPSLCFLNPINRISNGVRNWWSCLYCDPMKGLCFDIMSSHPGRGHFELCVAVIQNRRRRGVSHDIFMIITQPYPNVTIVVRWDTKFESNVALQNMTNNHEMSSLAQ